MARDATTLEELLLEHGLLKPEQLEDVQERAKQQGKKIAEIIREEQLVYPEPLAQLKAEAVGVPYVDLRAVRVDPAAREVITDRAATTYQLVVFGRTKNKLKVAMAEPDDYQALEAIRFIAKKQNLTPEIYCASPTGIEGALRPGPRENITQALRDFGQEIQQSAKTEIGENRVRQTLEDVPVTKIFAVIMRHAVEGLASDVHIEPLSTQLRVRYRIHGQLHTSLLLPLEGYQAIISRVKILANMQVGLSSALQEGQFTFAADNQVYSVRVAIIPTARGESVTLHLVDTTEAVPSLAGLGLVGRGLNTVKEQLQERKGLVIVAGPDGSGKSTSLNAILSMLNNPAASIATVEETIEYEMPGVAQTQIDPTRELTYERVLQSLLKQDVDVIMVEEIRGDKMARLLTKGALAGRLMLSTMHARDSLRSIPRLIDIGVSSYVLSSSLRLVIAQRLVPKLCQSCKQPRKIPKDLIKTIKQELKAIDPDLQRAYAIGSPLTFYESTGCAECHERKFQGQVAVFDVLKISKTIAAAIASNANYDVLDSIAAREGHLTLRQDGLLKVLQGLVRYDDVVRVAA